MSAYANSDPKTAVMRQIQQEAAMQNARMLVEVLQLLQSLSLTMKASSNVPNPETQRTLLRTLHTETGNIVVQGRRGMLHCLYGEIYDCLEHGVEGLCCEDTEGGAEWTGGADVLDGKSVILWLARKRFTSDIKGCEGEESLGWVCSVG